jgi:hypothetical protein
MYPPLLSLKPQGYIWSQFTEIIWQFTKTPINFLLKTSLSSPTTHLWRHRGERKYSSYPFLTSALDSGEWSVSRPGRAVVLGRGPLVPTVQRLGGVPELVWTQRLQEKSFRLCHGSKLNRPVIQPIARHYADWATRLTVVFLLIIYSTTEHSLVMP